VDLWLDRFREFWAPHLAALETELASGKRRRRIDKRTSRKGDEQ
jgi:hypothetical protein